MERMRVTEGDRDRGYPSFYCYFSTGTKNNRTRYVRLMYTRSIAAIVVHVRSGWLSTNSLSLWPSIRFPLRSQPFISAEHVVPFAPEEKKRKRRETAHTARDVGDFNSTGLLTLGSFEAINTDPPHPLSCKNPAGPVASLVEHLS